MDRGYGHGKRVGSDTFSESYTCSSQQTFGYMFPDLQHRKDCILPFTGEVIEALEALGEAMGRSKPAGGDSPIPAGFTYFGQFVDHDITSDPTSSLDAPQDPARIRNFRTPTLELDNVYGRGPADDPFLYVNNVAGSDDNGVKLLLGTNQDDGPGGPPGAGTPGDFDVPRGPNLVALLGDPRNDENLVVSQLQHAFLKLHNAAVDRVRAESGQAADTDFDTARRLTRHHYQWAVLKDLLPRIVDPDILRQALLLRGNPFGRGDVPGRHESFAMPVEFSVAAYRFGHSMVRDRYDVNANFPNEPFSQLFAFVRPPHLPVRSNWVVDFNRFFETPADALANHASRIDTKLAGDLDALPGESGIMAFLAVRNLRRGLAFRLPGGQAVAREVGEIPLSADELLQGATADEAKALHAQGDRLLRCTPLWYYVLKEAEVREGGTRLGGTGSRIVAATFARILAYDRDSVLYYPDFEPSLGSTLAELLATAGVL